MSLPNPTGSVDETGVVPDAIAHTAVASGPTCPPILRRLVPLFVAATFLDGVTFPLAGRPVNLSYFLGLALAAGFIFLRGKHMAFSATDMRWYLAFALVITLEEAVRLLWTPTGAAWMSLRYFFSYVQVLAMFFVVRDLARDARVARDVAVVVVLCVAAMSVIANLGMPGITEAARGGRFGIAGMNLNHQALLYLWVFLGIFSHHMSMRIRMGWQTLAWGLLAASILFAFVQTGSRGGGATLAFGLAIGLALNFTIRKLPKYVLVVPALLLILALFMVTTNVLSERFESTLESGDTGYRMELAVAGTQMIRERPILGWGASYVAVLGDRMGLHWIGAHNTYLQLLLSFGILGVLPLLMGVVGTTRASWASRTTPEGRRWLVLILATLLFGVASHVAYHKHFWLLLALASNSRRVRLTAGRRRLLAVRQGPRG